MTRPSRLLLSLVIFALAVGLLRALTLVSHTPLLAIANSFDQARYTGCFELFPDRPPPIRPDENSPNAPFEFYRFLENPVRLCYGSSELLLQGTTAAVYGVQELAGVERHSVRWIGYLRLALLTALVAAFCRAWWRRGKPAGAVANAALFALVLTDPADTMYFNTFYAEATALFAAYALFNLVLLYHGQERTRRGVLLLGAGALLLATSKIQHLLLPTVLALVVLAFGRRHTGRWPWQGYALLGGAVLGALFQFAQLSRGDLMMQSIRSYNRAHVIFTGLLPAVRDPAATLVRLGMPARCAEHTGKAAWQMPGMPEDVCPGIEKLGRVRILFEFVREPMAAVRYLGNGLAALNPWLPRNLGHVEGEILGKLPARFVSLNGVLDRVPPLRYALFALPLVAAALAWRRRPVSAFAPSETSSAGDPLLLLGAMTSALIVATLGITLAGDGIADVAKQGHLIFNASLAWVVIAAIALAGRLGSQPQREMLTA
ncbi:hypothetical protein [Tahibacter soli]|uniref:Uncharacterized protein n=1 Tax=Tahibacter soli TaxID=2983605 RepID=A0A9X3YM08_9GAMM|nr:hypothetical protein [Tahibacter soli]MDC8013321.1 hypothetical protein [Tahibacter soli]